MRRCDVHARVLGTAYERCPNSGTWAMPLDWRNWALVIYLCKEHLELSRETP